MFFVRILRPQRTAAADNEKCRENRLQAAHQTAYTDIVYNATRTTDVQFKNVNHGVRKPNKGIKLIV